MIKIFATILNARNHNAIVKNISFNLEPILKNLRNFMEPENKISNYFYLKSGKFK